MSGTITAIIVPFGQSPVAVRESVRALREQSRPPAEILIVDNHPSQLLAGELDEEVRVISTANDGYPAAVNTAARVAGGEYLLLINPDAAADPGCLERLAGELDRDPRAAVCGAQILLADGLRTNAGDNPLHVSGISPSGRLGQPPEHGRTRQTIAVSGACCMLRRSAFERLGGLKESVFLYYDDVDFCWRARIAGHSVLFCPRATVRHDYDFSRHAPKWGWLEQGRLSAVLSNYERRTLIILLPLLAGIELVLLVIASREGWLVQKLSAYRELWRLRSQIRHQRRAVAASRRVPDRELMPFFSAGVDSPLLPRAPLRAGNVVCSLYMAAARRLI